MAYETILVSDVEGVRTITLNRPKELNAADHRLTRELRKALKETARDKTVRCLVLAAAGRAFCAGQDLKEATAGEEPFDFSRRLREGYNPVILQLQSLAVPTLASINGVAAGAGWSLALACDLRIASSRARFVSAFSSIGLIPDSGMTWTLPRLVGYARALEITWSSDAISAETALQWGLIHRMVEPDALCDATAQWALRLARGPTRGYALAKRALIAGLDADLETQLEYEAVLQGIAGQTRDYEKGVSAFIHKRQPEFTGE